MADYIENALFAFSAEGEKFLPALTEYRSETNIQGLPLDVLCKAPEEYLKVEQRVIVAADLAGIKKILQLAVRFQFSVAFIPLSNQKSIAALASIPTKVEDCFELALGTTTTAMDLVYCNEELVLFQASLGDTPLITKPDNLSLRQLVADGVYRLRSLSLKPLTIATGGENPRSLSTAACGCLVLHNPKTIASRLIHHEDRDSEGMVSMVITAPLSVTDYIQLLWRILSQRQNKTIPRAMGYIKCPEITIGMARRFSLDIDGEKKEIDSDTIVFKAIPEQVAICTLDEKRVEEKNRETKAKERYNVGHLPTGKEIDKAVRKHITFFPYASEERFKDLFLSLRADARIDTQYIVLMVLSTLIAGVGLYLDSASVIIGAMLLAPLMAPIISAAMGVLRGDQLLLRNSTVKIATGIVIAIATSAVLSLLIPFQSATGEMEGRLHPTVLDLMVAVLAGVAGAYTKSFKEILQSLAGVAIAVALVPPLATAGIGLGRLDPSFFGHAFLLFATNLSGILVAAVITFRLLGFSSAVQSKRRFAIACCFLLLITIPLFMSYKRIIEQAKLERNWRVERFYINGKYLIVNKSSMTYQPEGRILQLEVLARDQLDRNDFAELKRKIRGNFGEDIVIRAQLTYLP